MDLVRFKYGENNVNTGPLKEIPDICIDHFLGNDLNSSVFFLSHSHTDHLVGLETDDFLRRLRQPGVKLYCHLLTPILLGSFTRYLQGPDGIRKLIAERKIIPLETEKPIKIRIPKLSGFLDVTVTLFSAGHCPGSVMFLFETSTLRILHTGDFRLTVDDLQRMPLLHKNKVPKPIDHLYIDTTFCSLAANFFPDRKKILKEAFDNMRNWLCLSDNHVINISFSAKFAHEYVLLEINRVFGQKIHVNPERLEIYKHIPEIEKIVTLNSETQFHLCGNRSCMENTEVMTVRLSSMWYTKTKESLRNSFITWRGRRNMVICYAMHSSLEEIGKTIDYLKPKVVTPLVLPVKAEMSEVNSALRSVTESSFQIEDYRSGRNDFEGIELPKTPCIEEVDETDEANAEEEDLLEYCEPQEELESPAKRLKLDEESSSLWSFKLTPSPSSKNSQSSSEGGSQNLSDGSQEINSQEQSDDFAKPYAPVEKADVRRNLCMTSFNGKLDSPIIHHQTLETDEYNDDDLLANSQRL